MPLNTYQLAALRAVRDILASNLVPHLREADWDRPAADSAAWRFNFNMLHELNRDHSCGSIACVGGLMALSIEPKADPTRVRKLMDEFMDAEPRLRPLFFPVRDDWDTARWDAIDGAEAARAIDRFLDGAGTAETIWAE